jgi:hypothetical protein
MVFKERDPLTGASRDALFMSSDDVRELGLATATPSACDRTPARSRRACTSRRIRPRNVQMFFPEANPLIAAGRRDEVALVPDYNAVSRCARVSDVTGVLLAGGASRRFPPNKLLHTYEGGPLFWRPLRRARDCVRARSSSCSRPVRRSRSCRCGHVGARRP